MTEITIKIYEPKETLLFNEKASTILMRLKKSNIDVASRKTVYGAVEAKTLGKILADLVNEVEEYGSRSPME